MKKIKVAHVIRVFSYGGAEVLLRECFSHPYFKEHMVSDLYILDHKKLGLVNEVKADVNAVHHFKIRSLKFIIEYVKFLNYIIKSKYDVVHMHLPVAGWMSIPAKIFTRKTKFVYTEHNLVTFYSRYNYYLIGFAYRFFDCIIYVSQEVGEVVGKLQKRGFFNTQRTAIILNGVNTDKFSNVHGVERDADKAFTVGLVARFRRQKRVDKWVKVAAEINKINPAIKFLMAGDGPDDIMLRKRITALNMQHAIELPGMLTDTVSVYERTNIFLLTSDFEGLPLALMEAMSCGCVPVVSNVGGIKQLKFEGFGYKYDVFDVQQIAIAIAGYAEHPQQFKTESAKARAFIEKNYSLTKQVHEVIALYNLLVQ